MSFTFLSVMFTSLPSEAYRYEWNNKTGYKINIDFGAIGKSTMFNGKNQAIQDRKVVINSFNNGNFITVKNAGKLYGPPVIEEGQTVAFGFANGLCINLNSIKVSINDGSYENVKVVRVPNEYIEDVIKNATSTGEHIGQMGDAVGSNENAPPEAQMAGQALGLLGGVC